MTSFYYYNPTRVYFGRRMIKNLRSMVSEYNNILFVYGQDSIKRNGLYAEVMCELEDKNVMEFGGVMPNPTTDMINNGVSLCRKNDIDFVVAAGGGSVCDSAKLIAAGACLDENDDFWDEFFVNGKPVKISLPTGIIITAPGSGSEMSCSAVATNPVTMEKRNSGGEGLYPLFCIIDAEYTYSLSAEQMACGCVDAFVHLCETYFSTPDEPNLSDYMLEAVMKCLIDSALDMIDNPNQYRARANIMWCSTVAMNGIVKCCKRGDWFTHVMEHEISGEYPEIPHGAGLAALYPQYLKLLADAHYEKLVRFAKNVWGISGGNDDDIVSEAVRKTENFFKNIGADCNLPAINTDIISGRMEKHIRNYPNIKAEDIRQILNGAIEKTMSFEVK